MKRRLPLFDFRVQLPCRASPRNWYTRSVCGNFSRRKGWKSDSFYGHTEAIPLRFLRFQSTSLNYENLRGRFDFRHILHNALVNYEGNETASLSVMSALHLADESSHFDQTFHEVFTLWKRTNQISMQDRPHRPFGLADVLYRIVSQISVQYLANFYAEIRKLLCRS